MLIELEEERHGNPMFKLPRGNAAFHRLVDAVASFLRLTEAHKTLHARALNDRARALSAKRQFRRDGGAH
jgi:hypothetical protein